MTSRARAAELGLGDELDIARFSPAVPGDLRLNDGVDEALAGADLLEHTVVGFPANRRQAKPWIDSHRGAGRSATSTG